MLQKQKEANILSGLHSKWMGILYWKQSAPSHLAMIYTIKHLQIKLTKHYQSASWHMCIFHHFWALRRSTQHAECAWCIGKTAVILVTGVSRYMVMRRETLFTDKTTVIRSVHTIVKSDYQLHHVCPSVWNNSATTGQIFWKFHIWVFFKNKWRKFKFQGNVARITGILLMTYVHLW